MAAKKKTKKTRKSAAKTAALTMDVATIRVFLEAVEVLSELASAIQVAVDDPGLRKELQKKGAKKPAKKSSKKRR